MTYENARNDIAGLSSRGIAPGLDNIRRLCAALGNPQNALNFVHIAGTNGKGSSGAFLASALNAAQRTAGRFVSPAVGGYLEAFTYNGLPVTEELYAKCASPVISAIRELEKENCFPTSFEAETAVAFLIFRELAPDYVLLECGMGGRLDSTNVISAPYASLITSISADHKKFLGNTPAEIAFEKSGIIKDRCPVVTCMQSDEVMEVIADEAKKHASPLFIADEPENIRFQDTETVFTFEDREYKIRLAGAFQPQNAVLAIKTAQLLGISSGRIREGIWNAQWEYRFERTGKYILDGAHNEAAAAELARSMDIYLKDKRTALICGCFRDKDYMAIARITAPYAEKVFCIKPPSERGLESAALCRAFEAYGAAAYDAGTMEHALEMAGGYEAVVIFGSLSILGGAKRLISTITGRGTENAAM